VYPNLKLQLWKTGIRQNRLAQLLGMDETMLSRVVNGFRDPNPKLRVAIAKILECDERWLFEPTPQPDHVPHPSGSTVSES
jgi:transcriptional regulator with XRE-family HTH domain